MKLIETIANQYNLTGEESVLDILNKFRVESGLLKQNVLPLVRKQVLQAIRAKQSLIKDELAKLVNGFILPHEKNNVDSAVRRLVADYLCSEFGEHYDTISPDLFKLVRKVEVNAERKRYNDDKRELVDVKMPLFVSAEFGQHQWKATKGEDIIYDSDRYSIEMSSAVPPLTDEAKTKAKEARAIFSEIYARALKTPVIGDYLLGTRDFNQGGGLEFLVSWIPKPSELQIKATELPDPDPLLVGRLYNKTYLIANWNVSGEEPYEHYLANYLEHKKASIIDRPKTDLN